MYQPRINIKLKTIFIVMELIVCTDAPLGRRDSAALELKAAYGYEYLQEMWREHMRNIDNELAAMGAEQTFAGVQQGMSVAYYKVPFENSDEANRLAFMYRKSDKQNSVYLRLWIERRN